MRLLKLLFLGKVEILDMINSLHNVTNFIQRTKTGELSPEALSIWSDIKIDECKKVIKQLEGLL
jgi:hypothetical protein